MASHLSSRLWWLAALAGVVAGCGNDEACGPNMRFVDVLGVCVCDDNAIVVGGGCTPCATDEIVVGIVCGCAPGETKSNGVCAPVQGLDSPCDTTTPCSNPTYSYCAVRAGVGTCTNLCAVDTDCAAGYVCADWEPTPSCRTFTGYGASCAAPEDCASYDASLCIQGTCVVHGCTVGVDDCPRDTKCCDFTSYGIGTLCAPPGTCP